MPKFRNKAEWRGKPTLRIWKDTMCGVWKPEAISNQNMRWTG